MLVWSFLILFVLWIFVCLPHYSVCGILVPWPGIKPVPLALEAWSLNHWMAKEFPVLSFFFFYFLNFLQEIYIPRVIWKANNNNKKKKKTKTHWLHWMWGFHHSVVAASQCGREWEVWGERDQTQVPDEGRASVMAQHLLAGLTKRTWEKERNSSHYDWPLKSAGEYLLSLSNICVSPVWSSSRAFLHVCPSSI